MELRECQIVCLQVPGGNKLEEGNHEPQGKEQKKLSKREAEKLHHGLSDLF